MTPPPDRPLHGAPFPPGRLHPRLYLAEFAGTALLVLLGLSVVIALFGEGSPLPPLLPDAGMRRFVAGALFGGVGALIAVSPLGRISGAHINPAVTLAFWLEGKLAWRDAALYAVAQLAGGVVGALPLLAWGEIGRSVRFGATLPGPGFPAWLAAVGEAGVTFALVVLIFVTAAHASTRHLTPLGLPPLFAVLVWLEAPLSGTSANPARSLGPAIVAGTWHDQWVYFAGPCAGAAVAIAVLRLELIGRHRVEVARLFHFHADAADSGGHHAERRPEAT
jgi:aquaporin Z